MGLFLLVSCFSAGVLKSELAFAVVEQESSLSSCSMELQKFLSCPKACSKTILWFQQSCCDPLWNHQLGH